MISVDHRLDRGIPESVIVDEDTLVPMMTRKVWGIECWKDVVIRGKPTILLHAGSRNTFGVLGSIGWVESGDLSIVKTSHPDEPELMGDFERGHRWWSV
jgi:hypothetical protein